MTTRGARRHRLLVTAVAATMMIMTGAVAALSGGSASAEQAAPPAGTAGCGASPTLRDGTYTIQSGGRARTYILRLPAGYSSARTYRLVVGLHWLNGSANDVVGNGFYGLQAQSAGSAIFVAPQGLDAGWANTGGRDVTLVDDILRVVENDLCVDPSQRFALGFSYGGAMTFTLACARPTVFRAVAPIAGANLSGGCTTASQPVAYFGIHGTRDSVLNISAGRSLRDTFVRANGCTSQNPPEPANGSGTHITTAYTGCRAGYPVQWAAHDGDHVPLPTDRNAGTSWVGAEVWRFFSQFASTSPTPEPTTPGPTTPPPSTPAPGGACRATSTVNAWNNGLTANITLTNTGSTTLSGWNLAFTLPAGQTITSGWNAGYAPSSGRVTATNVAHNAQLPPGGSVTFGFQATHTGDSGAPAAYALNGTAC